jgi:hypothetical protein
MRSAMYPNQAFRIGDVVWGLQFHIEVDEAAVVGFLDAFGSELEEMAVGPEGIRREAPSAVPALAPRSRTVCRLGDHPGVRRRSRRRANGFHRAVSGNHEPC